VFLAALSMGCLVVLCATHRNTIAGGLGLVVGSLLWLPLTRRWGARAHLCWAATTYLFVGYLAFMGWWTFASDLGPAGTVGTLFLLLLELFAELLGCAYQWELCDALGRERWVRRVLGDGAPDPSPGGAWPFVSLHHGGSRQRDPGRRAPVPQAHRLPRRRDSDARPAWPRPRRGAVAPWHGCLLA
jgi:hypothetical protein